MPRMKQSNNTLFISLKYALLWMSSLSFLLFLLVLLVLWDGIYLVAPFPLATPWVETIRTVQVSVLCRCHPSWKVGSYSSLSRLNAITAALIEILLSFLLLSDRCDLFCQKLPRGYVQLQLRWRLWMSLYQCGCICLQVLPGRRAGALEVTHSLWWVSCLGRH